MQNVNYGQNFNPPPSYEPQKEAMEFRNCTGQTVQSTVVTIIPENPPIRDHIIWSTFNFMYMNFCCLGLLAFAYSIKSRDRNLYGNKSAAVSYASTARSLNIAATVLSILCFIVVIIIYIFVPIYQMPKQGGSFNGMENPRFG